MNNLLYDIELEKKVLATLLVYPKEYNIVSDKLISDLFTTTAHIQIYETIEGIYNKTEKFDLISVTRKLRNHSAELEKYATSITISSFTSAHLEIHIQYLAELKIKRDFIMKYTSLIKSAQDPDMDIFKLQEATFDSFTDLFINKYVQNITANKTFSQLVDIVEENAKKLTSGKVNGIESSLDIINKVFGGWQKSDLTVIAARPAMGKTSIMIQQIVDAVLLQKIPVGVFTLEMSAEQIAAKIISNITNIPNSSFLRKGLSKNQENNFNQYKDSMKLLKIHIDDTPAISISALRVKAKMMHLRHKVGIIFVDYLQLLTNPSSQNREQEISTISRGLKAIAKELNIPVIALAQLSRKVEQRPSKRPLLSDLRDSGAIEQDADEVIFLYRPEYYGFDSWFDYDDKPTENEAEIIIQKNRHGGLLSERVKVDLPTSRFMNI